MDWQSATLSIIAFFGLLANGLILLSITRYKILRKNSYAYLVSLAICDSLKVVVIVSIVISLEVGSYHESTCMMTSLFGFTLLCCTTFHLAAESINRYLHVVWPYEYARLVKKKHFLVVIFLIWFLPLMLGIATPFIWFTDGTWSTKLHFHAKIFGCRINNVQQTRKENDDDKTYVILMYSIFFALPLLVMLIAYSLVLKTSYTVAKEMRGNEVKKKPVVTSPAVLKSKFSNPVIEMVSATYATSIMSEELSIKGKIQHQSERSMSIAHAQREIRRKLKQRKREIKSSKTILILISAFIVCNAPIFTVVWLTDDYDERTANMLLRAFLTLSQIQCFVNPFVYFLRLRDFKDARKKCKHVSRTIIRKTMRRL